MKSFFSRYVLGVLFTFSSCVNAQGFTKDVAKYLEQNFQVKYTPVPDDMMCKENAPTPRNIGTSKSFFNCQESRKNGTYVVIGWKLESVDRDFFQKKFAGAFRFLARIGPDSDTPKDVVTCTNSSSLSGDLAQCKVEYFGAKEGFKIFHFSVLYPNPKDKGLFVLAADNFLKQPELMTSIVLEYQSRIHELDGIQSVSQ